MSDVRLHIGVSLTRFVLGVFVSAVVYVMALLVVGQTVSVEGIVGAFVVAFALGVDEITSSRESE